MKLVYRIFFSGNEALKHGKEILYITERAVFRLTKDGVQLEEFAPGVDLDRDILKKMEFEPEINPKLNMMDKSLFVGEKMEIRKEILASFPKKKNLRDLRHA